MFGLIVIHWLFNMTQFGVEGVPWFEKKWLVVVLKINNPVAGLVIFALCTSVIWGTSKPFVVDWMSSIAELSGGLPSALMETCEYEWSNPASKHNTPRMLVFFMIYQDLKGT